MSITDGFPGRDLELTWNGNAIAGVREKGVTINGEPIDVTSDDDDGWRKLLTTPGQKQVDISVSGVTKGHVLKADWFANNRQRTATITYPDGDTITGTFHLVDYVETGTYNDATTFEANLQSSGAVTYTP